MENLSNSVKEILNNLGTILPKNSYPTSYLVRDILLDKCTRDGRIRDGVVKYYQMFNNCDYSRVQKDLKELKLFIDGLLDNVSTDNLFIDYYDKAERNFRTAFDITRTRVHKLDDICLFFVTDSMFQQL